MKRKYIDMVQERKNERSRNKNHSWMILLGVIIIVIMLILVSYWYFFLRTITIEELAHRNFKPGDSVGIKGTITEIEEINTTYGKLTLVTLDNYDETSSTYRLIVENDNRFTIGDNFQKTLHFEEYEYNGAKIVTASELYNTYHLSVYINQVVDRVSNSEGIQLKLKSIDGSGTTVYEVLMTNCNSLPLKLFNVSLYKVRQLKNKHYNHQNSNEIIEFERDNLNKYNYGEKIDFMESLEDSVSQKKIIEFIDMNSNELIDDFDIFKVYIPPTADENVIGTYYLLIGDFYSSFLYGMKYIINWYNGVYEMEFERSDIDLKYISSEKNGSMIDTTVKIYRIWKDRTLRFKDCNFDVYFDNESIISSPIVPEEIIKSNFDDNISVEYIDKNNNTLLDIDDIFIFRGLENQIEFNFRINCLNEGIIAWIDLVAGYGPVIGRLPRILFENRGLLENSTDQYKIEVSVRYWHPQLILNSTIFLCERDYYNDKTNRLVIKEGVVGSFSGVNVSFFDADNDSYFTTGDYFIIEPLTNGIYDFYVLFFKQIIEIMFFDT